VGLHQFLNPVFPKDPGEDGMRGGWRAGRELPELLQLQASGSRWAMRGRSVMTRGIEQVFDTTSVGCLLRSLGATGTKRFTPT
jgi:hypothetical protein